MSTIKYMPLELAELLALELPDLTWIAQDLLPMGSLTLFSAREKAGKSLLAAYLAVCVATGEHFLDRAVTPGTVLLVPAEEHLREVRDRLVRLLGVETDASLHVLPVNRGEEDTLDLANPSAMAELRRVVEDLTVDLLILDPMREIHALAENDADAMGPLLRPLRNLAHETDTAIVLLHHMGKGNGFRGSTAIRAACDQEWSLRGPDEATDQSTELKGTLTVKGRFGQKQVLGIRFAADGRWEVTAAAAQMPRSARDQILAHLAERGEPATAEEIARVIGAEVKTVQNIIRLEELRGRTGVRKTGTGRRGDPFHYELAEAS